jgi:hypothetical protein
MRSFIKTHGVVVLASTTLGKLSDRIGENKKQRLSSEVEISEKDRLVKTGFPLSRE